MLRVVVAAPPEVRAPEDLARLPACADLIELRLDLLACGRTPEAVAPWIDAAPRPVLATVRSRAQGGAFDEGAAAAAAWLGAAVKAGAAWVDAEAAVVPLLAPLPAWVRLVASQHAERFTSPPEPPAAAQVVKQVGGLADAADLERYRAAVRLPAHRGRALMPSGPLAALRVLDREAALLYGSAGAPVVAGQPPLAALLDELRAGEVSPQARLFGLLGHPPAWSPSPALHNAVFRACGSDAVYVPLPGLSLEQALALPFDGLSVTTPFKEAAMLAAHGRSAEAVAARAANTLVRRPQGGWSAFNTDVRAILAHVPGASASGARAVVYGAGGYARAALSALRRRGYEVALVARDPTAARALAEAVGATYLGERFARLPADVVLLNATPAGAGGEPIEALDVDLEGLLVLDAPYAGEGQATWLARTAEAGGARLVDGLALLLTQAAEQAQAFSGVSVEADLLELALRPRSSLLLVGLRGSGKTTVGRALARELGRPFVDLDDEVLRLTGRSAAQWIDAQGVEALRVVEARALAGLEGRRGLVIATGGGVLERRGHAERLRALGLVVWLDVSAATAAGRLAQDATLRPRLTDAPDPAAELARLKTARDPHYAAAAHLRLEGAGEVLGLVRALRAHWLAFEREKRRLRQ